VAKKKISSWLVGCGIGCAVLVVLCLCFLGGGIYYINRLAGGVDQAIETRAVLNERFGDPVDYVPPADGAVPAGRMETFLAVRRSLQPLCEKFDATFGAMGALDEKQQVTAGELFGALKSVMGSVPVISEFFRARNQALLDAEMGLGEYTYLYVLVYHASSEAPSPGTRLSTRVRIDFLGYLQAQAEAAGSLEIPGGTTFRSDLEREIAALEEDRGRVPWQDGLPETIAASLRPFRGSLDDLACPAAEELALSVSTRTRLGVQAD